MPFEYAFDMESFFKILESMPLVKLEDEKSQSSELDKNSEI